jgi:hypothetical protein
LYNDPARPEVCSGFMPEPLFCGKNVEEALKILSDLEYELINSNK